MTGYKKETHILFNELEPEAYIETYNYKWKKRLTELCEKEPENYRLIEPEDNDGRMIFKVNKKRLPLPHEKRKMSEEQKRKLAEQLAKARKRDFEP